jgi:diguanylate cyclase (GGDEF)-like protein
MPNFQSIQFRIIALGIATALIGVVVRQYMALPLLQEHVRKLAEDQQSAIATYIARDVDQHIVSRLELIERFAADLPPALAREPEKLQAWIKERQRINPAFNRGLLAVRPDGHGLLAEYPVVPGRRQEDYAGSDWLLAAARDGKRVMGKPARERASGEPAIVFAAPVRDADGTVVTVLAGVALLQAPGFLDRLQETKLGETGGFLLISPQDRLFVLSSDPTMVLKPTPPEGVNLLHDRAMSGFRGTGITINARGVEELSAMVSVPGTGWFVVARMPTEEALRPATTLRAFAIKASAVLLLIIVAILLVALPRVLRPLSIAAEAMFDMASGKRELAPLPVTRIDEVGKLVSGFNVLVDRLRKEEAARKASEARLTFLAHHDSLTGLYNRAMLEERLEMALAHAERDDSQIALLFCDLDGFKAINDQYGHEVGDEVLRQVAGRLVDGRRKIDTVARLGGDEFVILLAGLENARAGASAVARQCLGAISEPFQVEGKSLAIGMSIGIALHAGRAVAPSYLISQADIAMYHVKNEGKGNFFFMDAPQTSFPEQRTG